VGEYRPAVVEVLGHVVDLDAHALALDQMRQDADA
jgi:hypothetical protein